MAPAAAPAATGRMSALTARTPPVFAGRIGVTLLCLYLLGVTLRIGGCYGPDAAPHDERADAGPAVGAEFPAFTLRDVSGASVSRADLAGGTAVVVVVPSLDWSPPTKGHLLDLADAVRAQRALRVAVVVPKDQATPRSLAFVRERHLPFFVLIDDGSLVDRLGLATSAPDGTPAALPATYVLGPDGHVRLRDVRKNARTWLDVDALLSIAAGPSAAATVP
jgi:peroxiredoxin